MQVQLTQKNSDCQSSLLPSLPSKDLIQGTCQNAPETPLENASQTSLERPSKTPLEERPKKYAKRNWGLPFFKRVLEDCLHRFSSGSEHFVSFVLCGSLYKLGARPGKTGGLELRARPTTSCKQWFCGFCGPAAASSQAREAFSLFRSIAREEIKDEKPWCVEDLSELVLTFPKELTAYFDQYPERVDLLTPMLRTFLIKRLKLKGALRVSHYSSSRDPIKPNWHVHVLAYGRRWWSEDDLNTLKEGWTEVVEKLLKVILKQGTLDSLCRRLALVLNDLENGKKIDCHVRYFENYDDLRKHLRYQLRSPMEDLVKKVETIRARGDEKEAERYLDVALYRLMELKAKLGRRKRSIWLGCLSNKNRDEFLKKMNVEPVDPSLQEQTFLPMIGFKILRSLYAEGLAICEKTGNYDEGGGFHPFFWNWEVVDGQGRKLTYHSGAARFVLPLACFDFGPSLPCKLYRKVDRGPPPGIDGPILDHQGTSHVQ
ncbi:hypothetical protein ES703_48187 [subsurface metagenome]